MRGSTVAIHTAGSRPCVGVRVSPSAPQTQLRGLFGDRLKVAVNAPPEDNRANREVEAALAGWLGVSRDQVSVYKGHASRDKVVAFTGLTEATLRQAIDTALAERVSKGDEGLGG
jgi:uncharacterized protein YggU (UPF0235/DUF167 family)